MSATGPTPSQAFLDQYIGTQLLAVSILFLILCTGAVALRFYSRLHIKDAPLGWDDYLMVPAYIFQVALCICGILHVKYASVGYHVQRALEIHEDAYYRWGSVLFSIYFFWNLATIFPRVAIICLYLRIFSNRNYRIASYLLIAFIVVYGVAFQFAAIFACSPVAYAWDDSIPGGKCFNIPLFFQLSTVPLIIADIPMLILPIPQVWSLRITRGRKLGIILTFIAGSCGLVASCLRLAFFISSPILTDFTWASANIITWTVIEPGLYVIAASLIAMRPVMSILMPSRLKSTAVSVFQRPSRNNVAKSNFRERYGTRDGLHDFGAGGGGSSYHMGRIRGDGFGPLDDPTLLGRSPSGHPLDENGMAVYANADKGAQEEGDDDIGDWREGDAYDHGLRVKKEVWVTRSPFPT